MSLTKLSLAGNLIIPRQDSLVSDIPAGDGKISILCYSVSAMESSTEWKDSLVSDIPAGDGKISILCYSVSAMESSTEWRRYVIFLLLNLVSANNSHMATSLSSFLIFLLSVWQVATLPILAGRGLEGGANSNSAKSVTFFTYSFTWRAISTEKQWFKANRCGSKLLELQFSFVRNCTGKLTQNIFNL